MNQKLLESRTFEINWLNHFHKTNITISIPSLVELECSSGGDWGPMYNFKLNPKELVKVSYLNTETNVKESYSIEEKTLVVESPMLATVREITPLVYRIFDREKGLEFRLYIKSDFSLNEYQIIRIDDRAELFSLKIAESDRSVIQINNDAGKNLI